MPENHKSSERLSSWKEIAVYLDAGLRTVIRWEKEFGLPVHRLSDSRRSRVFAYKRELDEWIASHKISIRHKQRIPSRRQKTLQKGLYLLVPAIVLLAAAYLFLFIRPSQNTQPFDFRIQRSTLLIINKDGKELWRHNTNIENLVDEKSYRGQFQYKRIADNDVYLPQLMMKDITGNGKTEVLFSTQTRNEYGEGHLLCFDHKGQLLWDFTAGREIQYGRDIYSPDFRIKGFAVVDLDGSGDPKIIVLANHMPYFPAHLTVLDTDGRPLGEYWNSGHVSDFVAVDLDGDGRKEIVMGGCNNEYGNACLIVLPSDNIKGGSPQQADRYLCKNLEEGSQTHYVLFPRTELDEVQSPVDGIYKIIPLQNGLLQVKTRLSQIIYEVDSDLAVKNVHLSHTFLLNHKAALAENKIRTPVDLDTYEEELAKNVLYYKSGNWVKKIPPL
jgi:hypothetical protein